MIVIRKSMSTQRRSNDAAGSAKKNRTVSYRVKQQLPPITREKCHRFKTQPCT